MEINTKLDLNLMNIKELPSFYGSLKEKQIHINSDRFVFKTFISISLMNVQNYFDERKMIHLSVRKMSDNEAYYLIQEETHQLRYRETFCLLHELKDDPQGEIMTKSFKRNNLLLGLLFQTKDRKYILLKIENSNIVVTFNEIEIKQYEQEFTY